MIIFTVLCSTISVVSFICSFFNVSAINPGTNEEIFSKNLLSPEFIKELLGDIVLTFQTFTPLGMILEEETTEITLYENKAIKYILISLGIYFMCTFLLTIGQKGFLRDYQRSRQIKCSWINKKYKKNFGIGTLIVNMMPYGLLTLFESIFLILLFFIFNIPLGI